MRTRLLMTCLLAVAACTSGSKDDGSAGGPGGATVVVPPGVFAGAQNLVYPVRVAPAADGAIWVSDAGADAVVGLRDGAPFAAVTGIPRPLGVAVAGNLLFVGSEGRHAVEVYDLAQRRGVRTLAGVVKPNSIAVAPDGVVYVADSTAHVVRIFGAQGETLGAIGGQGSGNGQFRFPVSVAADATRVVVGDKLNHRVQVFDRDGAFVRAFGSELTPSDEVRGRFTSINSVALGGGDVYVLDSAHSLVQVLDASGGAKGLLGYAGDCATCVNLALDIAVVDGRVLATDAERRRVVSLSTETR